MPSGEDEKFKCKYKLYNIIVTGMGQVEKCLDNNVFAVLKFIIEDRVFVPGRAYVGFVGDFL